MKAFTAWTTVVLVVAALAAGVALPGGSEPALAAGPVGTTQMGHSMADLPATLSVDLKSLGEEVLQYPYIFVFTHYEFIGDPAMPEGVIYHPDGRPSAKADDGSRIVLDGRGGWDPYAATAGGSGQYTIQDAAGTVTGQGSWQVTGFIGFDQLKLDGWWGIPGFKEVGWEGGPGAVSFSGFLTVNAQFDNLGTGVLRAWCLMPTAAMTQSHTGDGVSVAGDTLNFGGKEQEELSMLQNSEGVMFYSSDPNADGWVLNPAGIAVAKDQGLESFQAPSSPDGGGYNK